ncbi:ATP-binding protein [Catenulispora subtropica]|uniref:Histidine kinase/HSP90-like ATPase domain-containing protein n=1 Tax=Catenulispora subtropica TaxID=450798 RepID=A0ABP5CA79_9ACTN
MSYWSRSFPGAAECLAEVRHFTQMVLGNAPGADLVVLAISELAGNAIVHTASGEPGGQFVVHLAAFADRWQVRVDDEGAPSDPRIVVAGLDEDGVASWDAEAGRGLAMVAAISEKWGVLGDSRARAVWAEIPYPVLNGTAAECVMSGDMLDALEAAADALDAEDDPDQGFDAQDDGGPRGADAEREAAGLPAAASVADSGDAVGDPGSSATPTDLATTPPRIPAARWPGRVSDPKIAERHRQATHRAVFMRALIGNAYVETIGPRPLPYWPPFPNPHALPGAQAARAGHRTRELEGQEAG